MKITIKTDDDYVKNVWAGGSTTELFIFPPTADLASRNFELRVSSAEVRTEESLFSDFTGYKRYIAPLENNLKLVHDGKKEVNLKTCECAEFDGSVETRSFGKCRDFNLICRQEWDGRLFTVTDNDRVTADREGFMGIYALADSLTVASPAIESGKTTLQKGELLLVAIEKGDSALFAVSSDRTSSPQSGICFSATKKSG